MRCQWESNSTLSDAVVFPAFVANEADPLYIFSDAVIHSEAFESHPLAQQARARLEEARERTSPEIGCVSYAGRGSRITTTISDSGIL